MNATRFQKPGTVPQTYEIGYLRSSIDKKEERQWTNVREGPTDHGLLIDVVGEGCGKGVGVYHTVPVAII